MENIYFLRLFENPNIKQTKDHFNLNKQLKFILKFKDAKVCFLLL